MQKDIHQDSTGVAAEAISRRSLLGGAAAAGGMALVAALGSEVVRPPTVNAQTQPNDALTAARFSISIDGHEIAAFDQLESILSAIDISEGLPRRLPGKRTPPTVTLKRGMTPNIEMAAWHELVILGDVAARKSCSLTMTTRSSMLPARSRRALSPTGASSTSTRSWLTRKSGRPSSLPPACVSWASTSRPASAAPASSG
ncbi:MAG: twin-arginine translocation signal domain-containing protein [Dehalococcoidia bacterium]|nr:twin-arginine translocation signal domain-containing protein [Dehalococcoidia bacterium]